MFLFGHVGLTWGGVLALAGLSRRLALTERPPDGCASTPRAVEGQTRTPIDYRFVILGSMLPDLIDKPLGVYILRKELSNGRIFAHGLLFNTAVVLAALSLRRRSARPVLSLAIGAAAHLALDRMWTDPHTLLWPLLGWRLKRHDVRDWVEQMLEQLFTDPSVYVSEGVGALVVAALVRSLLTGRALPEFVRTGSMGGRPLATDQARLADREERPQ